jgi:hypothetical protein
MSRYAAIVSLTHCARTQADEQDKSIPGEQMLHGGGSERDVLFSHHPLRECQQATLWVTNYRLIFTTEVRS